MFFENEVIYWFFKVVMNLSATSLCIEYISIYKTVSFVYHKVHSLSIPTIYLVCILIHLKFFEKYYNIIPFLSSKRTNHADML